MNDRNRYVQEISYNISFVLRQAHLFQFFYNCFAFCSIIFSGMSMALKAILCCTFLVVFFTGLRLCQSSTTQLHVQNVQYTIYIKHWICILTANAVNLVQQSWTIKVSIARVCDLINVPFFLLNAVDLSILLFFYYFINHIFPHYFQGVSHNKHPSTNHLQSCRFKEIMSMKE